jgi:hypothetical protein
VEPGHLSAAREHREKPMASALSGPQNPLFIMYLASCPSHSSPTDSADEPNIVSFVSLGTAEREG